MIKEARPDLLLVAFGAPAQELWIARNMLALDVPVSIGVGGALDFLAGRITRAPQTWQRLGLEWLYRLIQQPWRWRRMSVLPHFALLVLQSRFSRGKHGRRR
jgi:N-acetylglucosaminyldiphosphoundecaprenol N-acetyl-beta-D-mannosaminyltransferase